MKASVLAATTFKTRKQLSDVIRNEDKVLDDSDSKGLDGDQTRNDLTKVLYSAKNVLNDKKSLLKVFLMSRSLWVPRSRL